MSGRELFRRLVHTGLGAGAFLLPVLGWEVVGALALAAIPFNLWLLRDVPLLCRLQRAGGSGNRALVFYPLAVLILVLAFRDDHAPIQAGWLALAVGDGLAPVLSNVMVRMPWPWNRRKSAAGAVAAFALATLAMMPLMPWPVAAAAGCAGLAAESLPAPIEDNLSVPAASSLAAWLVMVAWT